MDTEIVVSNKSMLSGMPSLLTLSGDEFVEVVRRLPDGTYVNYRTLVSKLRIGKSVFDIAVEQGYEGTEAEWLLTLVGESAYEAAVSSEEFVGTKAEWIMCMAALYTNDPENVGKVLQADELGRAVYQKLSAASVGLDKVNNTSDEDKPLSKAINQELGKYLLKERTTTEVMKVILGITGVDATEDKQGVIFNEGVATDGAEHTGVILRLKRGTSIESATYVGMEGTLFVDLTNKRVFLHDGVKAGGYPVGLSESEVQEIVSASLNSFEIDQSKVTGLTEALAAVVKTSDVGQTVASLVEGKVPVEQLPVEALATALGFTKVGEQWILSKDRVAV